MATATPKIGFQISDKSAYPSAKLKGVTALLGVTERGHETKLVKNWTEYTRYYGGLTSYSDFPFYCKQLLDAGVPVVVGRLLHYTDVADKTTAVGGKSAANTIWGAPQTGVILFQAKSVGSWGNGLSVTITASTVTAGYFNIKISLTGYDNLTQTIAIPETPTQQDIDFFNGQCSLVEVVFANGVIEPQAITPFVGGYEDYTGIVNADYEGDAGAGTGLYQFDESYEQVRYAIPENSNSTIHTILLTYASSRNTRCYFRTPLGVTGNTAVDYRKAQGVFSAGEKQDSFWATLVFGASKMFDPVTGNTRYFSMIGSALIAAGKRDREGKEWLSPCEYGYQNYPQALELQYNLAPQSKATESDAVHENRISPFISKQSKITWQGYWTLQVADSDLKQGETADLVAYIIRTLDSRLEPKLYQPNHIPTWKSIHDIVVGVMEEVKLGNGVSDYQIQDDSNVESAQDVSYNTVQDIDNGIYNFGVAFKAIKSLRYINIGITLNNSSVVYSVQ